jgi:small GTP-binding protein
MLNMLVNKVFDRTREPTIGIDFRCVEAIGYPVEAKSDQKTKSDAKNHDPKTQLTHYKLQCWDCAGQIRFRSIVKSYYRLAHIVYVVFDLTDHDSFERVTEWTEDVKKNMTDQEYALILIGNKCDLVRERQITDREIWNKVHEFNFHGYTPTSAKTGENIEDAINVGLTKAHQLIVDEKIVLEYHRQATATATATLQITDDDIAKPGCGYPTTCYYA